MHTNNSHIAKTPLSQPVEKAAEGASKTAQKKFGFMAALQGTAIVETPLGDVAGKLKTIPHDCEVLEQARLLGISLGQAEPALKSR